MGRLKAGRDWKNIIASCKFQFHYGTIKSKMINALFDKSGISIPLWDD